MREVLKFDLWRNLCYTNNKGNYIYEEDDMRTNYPKTDLQRVKEGLAQIYGEDNIITKNEIHGLTYDITLREPLYNRIPRYPARFRFENAQGRI